MLPGSSFIYDPIAIILFLSTLAMAPFVALMVSSFVKIVIVMNLIRQALGLQQVPPNMVINGLAMILTVYVMAPTLQQTAYRALEANDAFKLRKVEGKNFNLPDKFQNFVEAGKKKEAFPVLSLVLNKSTQTDAWNLSKDEKMLEETKAILSYVKEPMGIFLKKHSTSKQRFFFMKMAKRLWPKEHTESLSDEDLLILIPSFTISELTSSFEIGFLIYLPFIAIDLVISNILLAMGMMMVSPMTISLPFKLMLFVLVNGWSRLIEALLLTYR